MDKANCAVQSVHGHRLDWDESRSARPARKTSLFGKPALEAGRDEKARSVVALSRVPRLAGFAGSPPAAGPYSAVNRPLVRIPANQHTTTGTCEIGQRQKYAILPALQEKFSKKMQAWRMRIVKPYLMISFAHDCMASRRKRPASALPRPSPDDRMQTSIKSEGPACCLSKRPVTP